MRGTECPAAEGKVAEPCLRSTSTPNRLDSIGSRLSLTIHCRGI